MDTKKAGQDAYKLAKKLWPINRSITGDGVRETLAHIGTYLPELKIYEVASGTKVLDWEIPNEWNVKEAWIKNSKGVKIVDFRENNLHLLGYSIPVNRKMKLSELMDNLHSLPAMPNAIPYLTSYYFERWGFCITENQKSQLKDEGEYEVYIDSELKKGFLTYGELIIPGNSDEEIFLSTYVCHPSMGNNELSGPCLTTILADWISGLNERKYTYRIVFIPETIGSITYLSSNYKTLKEKVKAGFVITCVGDDNCYSYLPSRKGATYSDEVALHIINHIDKNNKKYTFKDRGSDERQYCSPGIDLPMVSLMRSKYMEYPEYHTSLDDLSYISPEGFTGSFEMYTRAIEIFEKNIFPVATVLGEPQLGKRGLYPNLSTVDTINIVQLMIDLLTYSDGEMSLLEISNLMNVPFNNVLKEYEKLNGHGLLVEKVKSND